jgi:hypothetical protein
MADNYKEVQPFKTPIIDPTDTIGSLDRDLSEFLYLCEDPEIDEVTAQTLKHHADDMIGVGQKALSILDARMATTHGRFM